MTGFFFILAVCFAISLTHRIHTAKKKINGAVINRENWVYRIIPKSQAHTFLFAPQEYSKRNHALIQVTLTSCHEVLLKSTPIALTHCLNTWLLNKSALAAYLVYTHQQLLSIEKSEQISHSFSFGGSTLP